MVEVLVMGASGLLGQHLYSEAQARGAEPRGTYGGTPVGNLEHLDLADAVATARFVRKTEAKTVFLAGAVTAVDDCEANPRHAEAVNAGAPNAVARACASLGARLVLFSTDYVFDGRAGPSDETKNPSPVNVYGRTKLAGERSALAVLPSALVIRTCANFGWNRLRGKENSVTWILNRLRRAEPVSLFTDQWVSPSYVPWVARVAFDLVTQGASGIFHVATRDCLTRLELGEVVCKVFGHPKELLKSNRIDEAHLRAPRPRHSCLSTRKLERFLHIESPSFPDALLDMREAE